MNKMSTIQIETQLCTELLRIFRIFNTVMGLPIFVITDSLSSQIQVAYSIYQHFTEVIIFFGVMGQFWAVPIVLGNMNILCACLASGTHSMQVLLKTALFQMIMPEFRRHLAMIDKVLQKNAYLERRISLLTSVPLFSDFHYKHGRYVRLILVTLFFMTIASTSSYFLPIDIESILRHEDLTRQLTPIVFYFHFDFMYTPAFQIVNMFLTTCFYLTNLKTIVIDSFILALIVFHTIQFRHLRVLLEAVISNEDSPRLKALMTLWIQQHQAQLNLTYGFVKLMSPYLLLEFAYIFIHTCVPAFVITSTLSWTLPQKFAVFFIMGAGLCQLYFISRAGDCLTKAVEETTNALYRHDIFLSENKWPRLVYHLTALRQLKPLQLAAATVVPLSSPTFITISRLIGSYYMTLNEVQKRKI